MLSCDTIALSSGYFCGAHNLLGKNSDRPLGEAQPLVFVPGADHASGESLSCTHLAIPQAGHTYAVLGSQPYWIWGFETGVNECGLAIGNEAQGSRCEEETVEGLLGMDLLRLALERAATAREGVDVISGLLEQYGQNANTSQLFDRRYENAFLLVDQNEIWLLETAGRQWAAKRIRDWAAISNCYSIRGDFDLCSKELEKYARDRRWLSDAEPFDFAKAYTLSAPRQTNSVPRRRRLCKLIEAQDAPLDYSKIKTILRDHFEGELIEPRFGAGIGCFTTICMHAMSWDAPQTATSFLYTWKDALGIVCRYAASLPCTSVYLPVYWTGWLPASMSRGGGSYEEDSLWWIMERLSMAVSVDEERFAPRVRERLCALEDEIEMCAQRAEARAVELLRSGREEDEKKLLNDTMEQAVQKTMAKAGQLSEEICGTVRREGGAYGPRKEFLEAYGQRASIPLFS